VNVYAAAVDNNASQQVRENTTMQPQYNAPIVHESVPEIGCKLEVVSAEEMGSGDTLLAEPSIQNPEFCGIRTNIQGYDSNVSTRVLQSSLTTTYEKEETYVQADTQDEEGSNEMADEYDDTTTSIGPATIRGDTMVCENSGFAPPPNVGGDETDMSDWEEILVV